MVANLIEELKSHRKDILDVSGMAMVADKGAVFPYDLLVWAVTKRSLCLIDSFISSIETKNFIVAASIIRMHLDSVLRMHAATLVPQVHDYAESVLKGVNVGKLKDKGGNRLSDSYLADSFSKRCPWASQVYKETCGYIHLSQKHIYNTFSPPDEERLSNIALTAEDQFIPEEAKEEALETMNAITKEIVLHIYGWSETKKRAASQRSDNE